MEALEIAERFSTKYIDELLYVINDLKQQYEKLDPSKIPKGYNYHCSICYGTDNLPEFLCPNHLDRPCIWVVIEDKECFGIFATQTAKERIERLIRWEGILEHAKLIKVEKERG